MLLYGDLKMKDTLTKKSKQDRERIDKSDWEKKLESDNKIKVMN
jgi:hypothetical protein